MEDEIWAVVVINYGMALGVPVWGGASGNELKALCDPRSVLINNETKIPFIGVLLGRPTRIYPPPCAITYKVEDENMLRDYHESVTGLKLAPSGIKLV